jgi:hypothetical protein
MENRSAVTVADRVQANAPAEVWWFAHTPAEVALGADRTEAILTRNGKRLLARIESPAGAVFEVQEAAPLATSPNPEKQASNRGRRKLAIHLRAVKDADLRVRFAPQSGTGLLAGRSDMPYKTGQAQRAPPGPTHLPRPARAALTPG